MLVFEATARAILQYGEMEIVYWAGLFLMLPLADSNGKLNILRGKMYGFCVRQGMGYWV